MPDSYKSLVDQGKAAFLNGDYEKGIELFLKTAELGDADSQNRLGIYYANGDGVEEDLTKAAYWYGKAAEQGHATAQTSIGDCFYYGKGVPQDYAKAFSWYAKAVEQGNEKAKAELEKLNPTRKS